jgi:hypothetical protein
VRDEFENNKAELEKKFSAQLGDVAWKIEIDPLAIWPYATSDYPKDSLGACLKSYLDDAIWGMGNFKSGWTDEIVAEVNSIAYAHVLGMEYDDTKKHTYCGPVIRDGKLIILFSEGMLGTNISHCLAKKEFEVALNEAEAPPGSTSKVSFGVRAAILTEYNPKIDKYTKELKETTHLPNLVLDPNWDENYAILAAAAKANKFADDWDFRMPYVFASYFENLAWQMKCKNFHEDDMLYEAFGEACEKHIIQIKIVDKIESSYNETEFKDGVLLLKSQPKSWDVNVSYLGEKLVDQL